MKTIQHRCKPLCSIKLLVKHMNIPKEPIQNVTKKENVHAGLKDQLDATKNLVLSKEEMVIV